MKRTLSLALCLILSLALLAGCGAAPLPDGLTQESVTDAAAQTVAQLNDEDYDALFAGMTEEMTSAMTAEDLAEEADFFSFGTNDLTQTVWGFSRVRFHHKNDRGRQGRLRRGRGTGKI